MKIYNVIEWKWNNKTNKMEEVYSDSYEYNGPVHLLAEEDESKKQIIPIENSENIIVDPVVTLLEGTLVNQDLDNMCSQGEVDSTSSDPCCQISNYVNLYQNEFFTEYSYLGIANQDMTCPEGYINSATILFNIMVFNGQAPGMCCIPNTTTRIDWVGGGTAPLDLEGFSITGNHNPQTPNPFAFMELASLDSFKEMNFWTPEECANIGNAPNMFQSSTSTGQMYCAMTEAGISSNPVYINAESGHSEGDSPGMACQCSDNVFLDNTNCQLEDECGLVGYPCGTGTYNNTFAIQPGVPALENQCPVTDDCGTCGGTGSGCLDCGGVPNGNSKIDLCGACIDCGDPGGYDGGVVIWDGGADCPNHMLWNMRCTGCIQDAESGVCNSHRSVLVNEITGEQEPCESLDNNGNIQYICTRSADAVLGGGNYCPDEGEPGYGSVPGCCWYPTSFCDCDGEILQDDTYCDCNGNIFDDCGGCVDTTEEAKEEGQWEDVMAPLVIDGEVVSFYNTPNHPNGLFNYNNDFGSIYCNCGGDQTSVRECYDKDDDTETVIEIMACPDDDDCRIFGQNYVNDIEDAQDPGCLDPTACNYNPQFDFDCNGDDLGASGDTSCCVYPLVWCHALGREYALSGDGIEGGGYQYTCDVKGPSYGSDAGKPTRLELYCPLCDGNDYGGLLPNIQYQFGDLDNEPDGTTSFNFCSEGGYPVDQPFTGYGQVSSQIPLDQMVSMETVLGGVEFTPPDSNLDYWIIAGPPPYISGWPEDDVPFYIKDTTTSNNGSGVYNNQPGNEFELEGCADEGALNNQAGIGLQPLYWSSNFPGNMHNQFPVTTCDYCPGPTNELPSSHPLYGNTCTMGYEFIWNIYTNGYGISSAANVSSGADTDQNFYFYLGDVQSSQIIQGDNTGVQSGNCYCKNDLQFLEDVGQLITDNPAATHHDNAVDHPLNIVRAFDGGELVWDNRGRLKEFRASNGVCDTSSETSVSICQTQFLQALGQIPSTINFASELTHLDLSFGQFNGDIPPQIGDLENLIYLNLSYNNIDKISESSATHGIYNNDYIGICKLIERRSNDFGVELPGFPGEFRPQEDSDIILFGNKICPNSGNVMLNDTTYPRCLAPKVNDSLWEEINEGVNTLDEFISWENWIYNQLGFIQLPNYDGFNLNSQYITNSDGSLNCPLEGCTDPKAQNFWPEATESCGGNNYCCQYDNFLHFPWGYSQNPAADMNSNPEDGNNSPGGSYGGAMSLYEMVQALHAPICGFQYNSFGDIDVTNNPISENPNQPGACDYDTYRDAYGYLPTWAVNLCGFEFANSTPVPNGVIDWYDGLWLRSASNYFGDSSNEFCQPINADQQIMGDARPLEFIQRVGQLAWSSNGDLSEASYWLGLAFPYSFANYSMEGIEYLEDYTMGDPSADDSHIQAWLTIGRIDIASYIRSWIESEIPPPPNRPDDYELWETAPVHVSMSYSQKFISEAEAGYTLYPDSNSPGVLRRSGQWQCDDGGSSEICYTNNDACGVAPSWVDECIPCGDTENGSGGICVPLTLDVAAEGYEKISRTKTINVPYFHNGLSSTIKGQNLYTASMSSSNHPYYFATTNGFPNLSTSETQFYVSFGHIYGSGSYVSKDSVGSGNIGSSEAVYKQYASLLLDDEDIGFNTGSYFMISSGSDMGFINGNRDEMIYVLNFKRSKFEDQLENGTWTLSLNGSGSSAQSTIHLTDNSLILEKPIIKGNGGRRFDIISGSAGTPYLDYKNVGDRYGWFYPDAGIMVFGEKLIYKFRGTSDAPGEAVFNPTLKAQSGSQQLYPELSSSLDYKNSLRFINLMRNVGTTNALTLTGQKEVTEVTYVCRLSAEEFNFTNNFSILSGSGRRMYDNATPGLMDSFNTALTSSAFTGGTTSTFVSGSESITTSTTDEGGNPFIWPGSNINTMHGNPHTFITGIQLYDEHGEMVATAQLSKPFKKASDREAVIKVKLTF